MQSVALRVADGVRLNAPRAVCFACLASQQGVSEHDVRDAALVLIARTGVRLERGVCCECGRPADVIRAPAAL